MPSFYEGADAWFRTLLLNRVAGQAREYYFPFLARAMPARPVRDYPEFGGIKLSSFGTEGDFGIMDQIKVKVKKIHPRAEVPRYVHEGSNGDIAADVYSMETLDLAPGEIKSVSTGIAIELPNGFGAVIEDRSGLAISGITTLAGVVDTGYRGELSVVLVNLSKDSHRVNQGDRIAQLRLVHRIEACFEEVQELSQTERGVRGLGSSGKN